MGQGKERRSVEEIESRWRDTTGMPLMLIRGEGVRVGASRDITNGQDALRRFFILPIIHQLVSSPLPFYRLPSSCLHLFLLF